MSTVREAFMELLSRCDGATTIDGQGFNGRHAPTARSLGQWDGKWTPKQEKLAYRMLKTYKKQLTKMGYDYDALVKENKEGIEVAEEASFEIVETQYGDKLSVSFQYDAKIIGKIKDMDWKMCHRGYVDGAWQFDLNTYTSDELADIGFLLPDNIIALCGGTVIEQEDLEVSVVLGCAFSRVKGSFDKATGDAITDKLSFYPASYERATSYQMGEWDGRIKMFKSWDGTFPTGLANMVYEVLDRRNVPYTIIDERTEGTPEVVNWNGHPLRDYQEEVVTKMLEVGSGTILMPTGAGKTLTAMKIIQERGQRAVILVHLKELLYQWVDRLQRVLGNTVGMIGDGHYSEGFYTVAMLQSLKTKPLKQKYDIVIVDEVHHVSAETFQRETSKIGAKIRIGLSATPKREDNKQMMIWAQTGEIATRVTVKELVDRGYLAKPVFKVLHYAGGYSGEKYQAEYKSMVKHQPRNQAIVDYVKQAVAEGNKIYVDVKRIEHGKAITRMLNEIDISAIFISGTTRSDKRQEVLGAFEADGFVLVSTLIKEGVDLPAMSMVILAGGGKSGIMVIQTIGRSLRPKAGSNEAFVVDLKDTGYYTKKHYDERKSTMAEYYGEMYQPEGVNL